MFEDDKLKVHTFEQYYSMNLKNGEITDIGQEYDSTPEHTPKFDVEGYEYVSHTRDPWYYTLRNTDTNEEHIFEPLENGVYKEYKIITDLE